MQAMTLYGTKLGLSSLQPPGLFLDLDGGDMDDLLSFVM
jgi:hypothetical protein